MRRAGMSGQGAVADAAGAALLGLGWRLVADRPVQLLVIAPPFGQTELAAALAGIVQAPVAAITALAQSLPPPRRDAAGEWCAPAAVVLLVNGAALRPGGAPAAEAAATAALLAWMREATLRFGPRLRLNALALDPAAPGDLAPALDWLAGAHALAGQLLGAADPVRAMPSPCDTADSGLDPTSALDLSTSGPPVTSG